jgi:molecular chaperone HtpG
MSGGAGGGARPWAAGAVDLPWPAATRREVPSGLPPPGMSGTTFHEILAAHPPVREEGKMSDSNDRSGETFTFQAEVARLLQLMVHSVYTEKDIAVRELISNASDACDKLRYEALSRPELTGSDTRFAIRIVPDAEAGTLTIADNGIGMDRQELIDNLGTIARSGTRAFLDRLAGEAKGTAGDGASASEEAAEPAGEPAPGGGLIGQFGVGFYSAFMLADRVDVTSRPAGGGEAWTWSSDGTGSFSVEKAGEADAAAVPRGSRVRLQLTATARHLLEPATLERVVRTYSDHILFPVELVEGDSEPRQINAASAIWQRARSAVTADEHKEAYRSLTGLWDEPALTVHYKAEGRLSFAALLYVPANPPFDLMDPARKGRIKLYVRRVYITDDADLLPGWLRFVRGVVDSEDVPLNISREMLQNNPVVGQIRKALTQRVLTELAGFAAKEPARYGELAATFGTVLKEGIYEDRERQEEVLGLVRFHSSKGEARRSLADYLADMRPNQTDIYYLTGESLERLRTSPQLEEARARGIEVLLLADPIDAFWTQMVEGFQGKPLRSLGQGEADLSLVPRLAEAPAEPAAGVETSVLVAALKKALGERVADVKASKRLVESPACLVASAHGPDRQLERLLARQARGTGSKPVLEINPAHALVTAAAGRAALPGTDVADHAEVLLGLAYTLDGEVPPDPAAFAAAVARLAGGSAAS